MVTPIRVILVDDQTIPRTALAEFLERQGSFLVVGQAASGAEALRLVDDVRPDVVLMEIALAEGAAGGISTVARIRAQTPQVEVLILTTSELEADTLGALRAGAKGYLLKSGTTDELMQAIRTVHRGGIVVSPGVTEHLRQALTWNLPPAGTARFDTVEDPLTRREVDILRLIREGRSNREIGGALSISESTVKSHLHRMLGKLHLTSRTQLAIYAQRSERATAPLSVVAGSNRRRAHVAP